MADRRPPWGSAKRVAGLTAVTAAVALPRLVGYDPYYLYLLGTGLLYAALATAWNLLAFAGQISFGHAAFFGAGAYTSALLVQRAAWNPWLGIVAAAGAGAALALATLAYAEAWRVVALNWTDLTGGGAGLVGIAPLPALPLPVAPAGAEDRARSYYLALALLATALVVFATLRRTRVGLAWAAIREREARARMLGIAPMRYKLLAFVCSGVLTAAGGALYAHAVRFVEPDVVFGRSLSMLPLVMATFGGVHTLWGPPVGALGLYLASELLLHPTLPQLHQLPYALALLAAVLCLPRGLAGLGRPR
jgi:branched-chain amino acid transport system permease protein